LPETDPASAALLEELMRIAGQGWKESAIDALGTSFQAKRCVVMAARSLYGRHWRQTSRSEVASALRGCGEIMFAASEAAKQWAIESTLLEVSVAISFDFPRVWDLLRFCIGSKNRERLFILRTTTYSPIILNLNCRNTRRRWRGDGFNAALASARLGLSHSVWRWGYAGLLRPW
jgi:acyl-CoA reductase-like NAD-dependent aldehyde dehydrogenase